MEKEKELVVLYADEIAAKLMTVTGWVSRNGRFYGKDEHMARWDGSTHNKCDCGNLCTKGWTKCDFCSAKAKRERYLKYEFKEWDGVECVYSELLDKYFFDGADEIDEYIENEATENEINHADLMLVFCKENRARPINEDYWEDELPSEDGDTPKELTEKVAEFNKFLETLPPLSWSPSKIRTEYNP